MQALHQHHLALGLAPERTTRAEGLFHRRHRLPAKRREQPDGGLLDELVFGVSVGAHGSDFTMGRNTLSITTTRCSSHWRYSSQRASFSMEALG